MQGVFLSIEPLITESNVFSSPATPKAIEFGTKYLFKTFEIEIDGCGKLHERGEPSQLRPGAWLNLEQCITQLSRLPLEPTRKSRSGKPRSLPIMYRNTYKPGTLLLHPDYSLSIPAHEVEYIRR